MKKSEKNTTPSKFSKPSGIPRPRSKSGDRSGQVSRSNSQCSETRSKSAPRESPDMSERERYMHGRYQSAQDEDNYNHKDPSSTNSRQSPSNNIPRYQGISTAKYRQGILVNHQEQLDAFNSKSDFPNVFRSNNGKPDYAMLMGPNLLRTVEHQLPSDDISSMFQRPNTTTIPSLQHSACPVPMSPTSWGKQDRNKLWGNSGGIIEYQPIMSPNNNSTIGFKSNYSTTEELDNILAKYTPSELPQEQEYQVFQATIQSNSYPHTMESNYQQNGNAGVSSQGYNRDHQMPKQGKSAEHKVSNDPSSTTPTSEKLGVFGLPLSMRSTNFKQKENVSNKKLEETSNHSKINVKSKKLDDRMFPFDETSEGDLIIHPDQAIN